MGVFNFEDGAHVCEVKAGPKTAIHALKAEIETNTGIPIREQQIFTHCHKFKDDEKVGVGLFYEAQEQDRAPKVHFKRLTQEEAVRAEVGRVAIAKIKRDGARLADLQEDCRELPEVVLFAVSHTNPAELQYASAAVKSDKEAMLEALSFSSSCMYYIGAKCWQDRDFMTRAVSIDGLLLGAEMVPQIWRSDPEVVMYACEQHGFALKVASEELKDNRAVVMAAVNQRGTALMYASEQLKSDYYVVLDAVRNSKMAIVHAKGGLRDDANLRAASGQRPADAKMVEKVMKIKAKFHELDTNHDGFLSYNEMETVLKKGHPDMDDKDLRVLYGEMDTHKDGQLDFHEFCDYVLGGA